MDISKHICSYLSDNPSVVVPGLGRFTAVSKPSELRGNVVVPPVRTIEYNSSEDEDDGVLTAYIAQQENIDIEQATTEMTEFYNQLKKKLAGKKSVMLDKLGILSVTDVGDIVFEPDTNLFVERKDSYGLEQVNLQGNTIPQPEPIVFKDPVVPIEPIIPPVAPTQQEVTPTKDTTDSDSLFTSENLRIRENTERKQTVKPRQEPPVKPVRQSITPPPSKKQEKKKKTSHAGNGFPMWVLLVLLIAGGLGVGFYFFYPKLSPYIESTIHSMKGDKKTSEPERQSQLAAETEHGTPNPGVSQSLDDATEKRNALNPDGNNASQVAPDVTHTSTTKTEVTQPTSQPESQPQRTTTAPIQSGIGQGRYLLIAGSFTTQEGAEKFGKSLQKAGISYEIVDYGNERVRVAVASFDDKTEAARQVDSYKTKPYCKDVWVVRRKN